MRTNSDFKEMLSALNAARARFLVVGAYAVVQYTEPRYTKDLDLWVEPTRSNADRVLRALEAFGAPIKALSADDLCDPEIVYQVGVEPVRVDILTNVAGVRFATAYARATRTRFDGVPIRVLSLRDTMRAKRAAGRPQDLLDLAKLREANAVARKASRRPR